MNFKAILKQKKREGTISGRAIFINSGAKQIQEIIWAIVTKSGAKRAALLLARSCVRKLSLLILDCDHHEIS